MRIVTTMRAGGHIWEHRSPEGELVAPAGLFEMTLREWWQRAGKQRQAFIREKRDYSISQEIVHGDCHNDTAGTTGVA